MGEGEGEPKVIQEVRGCSKDRVTQIPFPGYQENERPSLGGYLPKPWVLRPKGGTDNQGPGEMELLGRAKAQDGEVLRARPPSSPHPPSPLHTFPSLFILLLSWLVDLSIECC